MPMRPHFRPSLATAAVVVALLAGCASPRHHAPVEDRTAGRPAAQANGAVTAAPAATMPADPSKPAPGAENAGKPGYFTVRPGDTLMRIGLETGQSWRDIMRWNSLDNPNVLEVGQVLRVLPPGADGNAVAARGVAPPPAVQSRPLDAKPPAVSPGASAPAAPAPAVAAVTPAATLPPASPAPAREGEEDINWMWPASGQVIAAFDEARNKGLAIAGKAGDPVLAAADGRVVYAGSGLRGYGNLVIVKHNNTYLTAYAHNQTLLVKEDQPVRRGQKIAEMGSSDADRVQLHFEIRRQGKPVDPAKLLPQR